MMIEPRAPKYPWGLAVRARTELYNDGSFPDAAPDTLLVATGGPGEIVQVGHHTEANLPLYMVDFGVCVLGCLEEEIWPDDGSPLPPPPPELLADAAAPAVDGAPAGTAQPAAAVAAVGSA